uniref:GBF1-like tetratricopeptide repeats domain-containing protein n=1 Tax=Plectus sambesii TaxID=2011161 RepID=A0A914WJB0_9BILA
RAFLIHDLQALESAQWENCFGEVLFPLLAKLLDNISPMDPIGMEETRVRAMQLLSKVLLNHLSPLSALPSFPALWLRILDYMERYLHTERSDLLSEAIPESLKNMILVLDNTGMFMAIPGLYEMTRNRLGTFLPELIVEILPSPPTDPGISAAVASAVLMQQQAAAGIQPTPEQLRHEQHAIRREEVQLDLEEVVVHSGSGATSPVPMAHNRQQLQQQMPPPPCPHPTAPILLPPAQHQIILHPPAAFAPSSPQPLPLPQPHLQPLPLPQPHPQPLPLPQPHSQPLPQPPYTPEKP